MKTPKRNAPLIALVAAVAVAAVPIGGALASRLTPTRESSGSAAPLSPATSPTPSPSVKPTPPPATPTLSVPTRPPTQTPVAPTSAPTKTPTQLPGPVKSKVDAAKLDKGRSPQLPHLLGREVTGGSAPAVKVPGSSEVREVGQIGGVVLAAVAKADEPQLTEMLRIEFGQVVSRTLHVTGIVTSTDHRSGAYLVDPENRDNPASFPEEVAGGTIHAITDDGPARRLELTGWNLKLLAFAGGKVYFRSGPTDAAKPRLFSWTPGQSKPQLISAVPNPTAVSPDGKLAASQAEAFVEDSCYYLYEIATGKRLWRTCEYAVHGFTPDGRTALAGFSSGVSGHGGGKVAALDTRTGNVLREWELTTLGALAEDDDNILILNDPQPGAGDKNAIVRCSVQTGRCELATGFTVSPKLLGH